MKGIETFIALNRFGLGAAPGEAESAAADPRGWLKAQIVREQAVPEGLRRFRNSDRILSDIYKDRQKGRQKDPGELKSKSGASYRRDFAAEVLARARHHSTTSQPFAERMVLFWSNHFTVSTTKKIIGPAIPAYEREAIRPHVFGRFADMLKAVCRHPCMISYLDNQVSMGDHSLIGRRRVRKKGNQGTLNENLAREILELHTLGVNGGYGQADVIELAKAISGWSHGGVRRKNDSRPIHGGFEFISAFHEPGPKELLGKRYEENGVEEGIEILDDLAAHPSTARFIATKLARHFVADEPPEPAVSRLAAVFMESNGDLAAVSSALVDLDAAWAEPLAKVKSPYELVISTHRVVGNARASRTDIAQPLEAMGQRPFSATSPAGWGDTASHWISPESLMRRIEWLHRFAAALPRTLHPDQLLQDVIGPAAADSTRKWVSRAPSAAEGNAMVLASPEFQRR